MKKLYFVALLSVAVSGLFAELSIKDIIKRFDEKLARNSIPKAEVVIGSINFGETETHGSAAGWMKKEIEEAAGKVRRIKIVRDSLKRVQSETKTRGLVAMMKKPKSALKKKYTISGTYIENKTKGVVSLTLYLEISEGEKTEVFATETATIPSSEFADYGLSLYPENIKEVESIEKDFEAAEAILETAPLTEKVSEESEKTESVNNSKESSTKENTNKDNSTVTSNNEKDEKEETAPPAKKAENESIEKAEAIQITAYMLDKKNNVVDTLRPGDVVKFLIGVDKDVYIRIMGIDANGNTFWLPIKDDFIAANTVRTFPDDNTLDYQVVDGVFGAEHLFIYASTSKEGLPTETGEAKYHPSLIASTTRGITAVKKSENISTGVFKIAYTVVP